MRHETCRPYFAGSVGGDNDMVGCKTIATAHVCNMCNRCNTDPDTDSLGVLSGGMDVCDGRSRTPSL